MDPESFLNLLSPELLINDFHGENQEEEEQEADEADEGGVGGGGRRHAVRK